MNIRRWTAAPRILAVATVVLLGACSTTDGFQPTEERQVLGEWCGTGGDRLQLGDDHKVSITGLSAKLGQRLVGQYDEPVPGSVDGSWTWKPAEVSVVALTFAPLGKATNSRVEQLRVANDGKKVRLLAYFGDFDSGYDYSFERCA
jgi:hypothetical protein